jgi:GAF domain-containing protein
MAASTSLREDEHFDLAAAYTELQNLLLEEPQLTDFLQQVAQLAAAVVPAAGCGVTMRRDNEVTTVASSGDLARQVDEIQYSAGQGPCLTAMFDSKTVAITDLATDDRWPDYRDRAIAAGVRGSLSLPLVTEGRSVGALNLYQTEAGEFSAAQVRNAWAFARQAMSALTLVLRHAQRLTVEEQLRDALASRTVIDQAMGILMGQRGCNAAEAFDTLRETSQGSNRKLREVAVALIEATTGEPPGEQRPFIER